MSLIDWPLSFLISGLLSIGTIPINILGRLFLFRGGTILSVVYLSASLFSTRHMPVASSLS